MFDVVTLGSATKDIFLFTESSILKSGQYSHFLEIPLDKKIEISRRLELTGGGATNAAATFRNFGKRVAVISKVGRDYNGDFIIRELAKMGASTKYMIRGEGETPTTDILVSSNGHMIILTMRGIADTISRRELRLDFGAKWMYIGPLSGRSYGVLPRVLGHCAKNGIKVALLPGSMELNLGIAGMADVLAKVDLVAMNLDEAGRFVGTGDYKKDLALLAQAINGTAIITMGSRGSVVASGGCIYRAGAFRARQINTIGTGDAYSAGFVTGMLDGRGVEDCINLASYNARGVVEEYGAKAGLVDSYPRSSVRIETIGSYTNAK